MTHVGTKLGLGPEAAAEAIVRVANARMAGAIRLVSIERGHDPQRFAAIPFGGGGALHAGALILDVGMKAALVPRFPGVTSALGCIIADIRHDQVQTVNLALAAIDAAALDRRLVAEATAAVAVVEAAGLPIQRIDIVFEADMHYVGQTHTVAVRLPIQITDGTTAISELILRQAFDAAYQSQFGRLLPTLGIRLVNIRTAAIGRRPHFDLAALAPGPGASLAAADRGSRDVWFGGWRRATIHDRLLLPVGAEIPGPAILEQPDATTIVDPGLTARIDPFGNVIVTRQ